MYIYIYIWLCVMFFLFFSAYLQVFWLVRTLSPSTHIYIYLWYGKYVYIYTLPNSTNDLVFFPDRASYPKLPQPFFWEQHHDKPSCLPRDEMGYRFLRQNWIVGFGPAIETAADWNPATLAMRQAMSSHLRGVFVQLLVQCCFGF